LIGRYTLPEMASIWTEEQKLKTWLKVELAIVDALSEEGGVPDGAATRIRQNARLDVARIREIENVTKHDVLSFVECVGESLGDDSRYFHMGVTSSDVLDTSLALLIRDATGLILEELTGLKGTLRSLAARHETTLIVGRTHGMHAEPTSLGLKFAVWYNDIGRAIERIETATDEVCVGKISGAVGNYSHLAPGIEEKTLKSLGLGRERPATQIVQRDRHASYMASLALAAGVMEKMAVELRHLQRTEVAEAAEPFTRGQKGSSSMPHKRNPIVLERITGLSRLVRAHAIAAFENVALWHERDISHSSVERIIIPDGTIAVHYMARCLKTVLQGLRVDTSKMKENIELTGGMVYSQRLMLCLMEAGWDRKRAYEKVQHLAHSAASDRETLKERVCRDQEVVSVLGPRMAEAVFDPGYYIRYAHDILHDTGIL
jgi:adenylosuccinate lyase